MMMTKKCKYIQVLVLQCSKAHYFNDSHYEEHILLRRANAVLTISQLFLCYPMLVTSLTGYVFQVGKTGVCYE